jgi:hypothetical protein
MQMKKCSVQIKNPDWCFANILAKEIAYFSNVLTLLAFSRKYQNICVQVLYMKLREIKKLVNF